MGKVKVYSFRSKEAAKASKARLLKKGYRLYSRLHKSRGGWSFTLTK